MKSIILCEGITDRTLLQYYLEKVYHWEYERTESGFLQERIRDYQGMKNHDDRLLLANCGGCSKILPAFEKIVERNRLSAGNESYENIVIITDRDEAGTEESVIQQTEPILAEQEITLWTSMENAKWVSGTYQDGSGHVREMRILLLVIPFEETGAMETFLLQAISRQDPYDAEIIRKGNEFVRTADPEERYLNHNKYKIKAEFDVYFSVRTSSTQFGERKNILKNVPWEQYTLIQTSFQKLEELSSNRR